MCYDLDMNQELSNTQKLIVMCKMAFSVQEEYIHKVSFILHETLQYKYHKTYGPPTSDT